MRRGQKAGAQLIFRGTPAYPAAFNDLNDAPPFFWTVGDAALLHGPTLGLVGTRNASSLGTRMSWFLTTTLGELGVCDLFGACPRRMPRQSAQERLPYWAVGLMLFTLLKTRN